MVLHILATYHTHDEEIEAVHLPTAFAAILEALTVCSNCFIRLYDIHCVELRGGRTKADYVQVI